MGLNISIERMPGWKRDKRFDYVRHSGDVAFATTDAIEWTHHPEDAEMRRPVDIEAARRWVRGNVTPAANAQRLLDGLDMLARDAGLWMSFGW
jgi:hypothetical protein